MWECVLGNTRIVVIHIYIHIDYIISVTMKYLDADCNADHNADSNL